MMSLAQLKITFQVAVLIVICLSLIVAINIIGLIISTIIIGYATKGTLWVIKDEKRIKTLEQEKKSLMIRNLSKPLE